MLDGKFDFISYNKTQLYVRRGNSFCAAVFGGVTAAAERRRRKELMERMERMERMLEALGNLVDNAIKYTESGSVRVSVTE